MQFFFYGKPSAAVMENPPANLIEKAKADWVASRELYSKGALRSVWAMGQGVIAIYEAASKEEVEAMVATMPMAQAGLIDIQIEELAPYSGFAPDFAKW